MQSIVDIACQSRAKTAICWFFLFKFARNSWVSGSQISNNSFKNHEIEICDAKYNRTCYRIFSECDFDFSFCDPPLILGEPSIFHMEKSRDVGVKSYCEE